MRCTTLSAKDKNGSLPGRPAAGQTLNPATFVTPTVRRLAAKLSHDQQRAIGSERCRVPVRCVSSSSEVAMTTMTSPGQDRKEGQPAMKSPPIVSPQEWDAAREQMLVKEKA